MEEQRDQLEDHVLIGRIIKAHGIKGEVRVYPYSGTPENFQSYKKVVLAAPEGDCRHVVLVGSRSKGNVAILKLKGVAGREGAEALRDYDVWLHKSDLPELEQDEYYWHHLQGLQVVTDDDRALGTVVEIFNNNAHDVLVVKGPGREYMIPMVAEAVQFNKESQPHIVIVLSQSGLVDLDD